MEPPDSLSLQLRSKLQPIHKPEVTTLPSTKEVQVGVKVHAKGVTRNVWIPVKTGKKAPISSNEAPTSISQDNTFALLFEEPEVHEDMDGSVSQVELGGDSQTNQNHTTPRTLTEAGQSQSKPKKSHKIRSLWKWTRPWSLKTGLSLK
ncbi:hypothetical protein QJS10_CPA02g00606 [Acorus calamus]|uniref:Uncharacterized protein n=1 Tax=Acorus calamus TaxID=4465 RepID=A0AAV9FEQ2_ACOCL|nr:hypothetical protein QJS10_CPA02g00606 [Acorus calamus]